VPEKEGMSTGKKAAICLGVAAGAAAVIALVLKGRIGAAKEEVIKLAEHVQFKKAKTLDEAAQFAKTHFGIKKYDVDDLSVANWINKGLVKVNNKTKGQAVMPKEVKYEVMKDARVFAAVNQYGRLHVNKTVFTGLDEKINIMMKVFNGWDFINKTESKTTMRTLFHNPHKKYLNWYFRLWEKGKLKDVTAKQTLLKLMGNHFTLHDNLLNNTPEKVIAHIYQSGKQIKNLTFKEAMSLSKEEMRKYAAMHARVVQKNGNILHFNTCFAGKFVGAEREIYHELGHLHHDKVYEKAITQMNHAEAYTKNKKEVPQIVKDFLASKEEQEIAAKVSEYAKTSPGEFVAETYSYLIAGEKFSDKVMNLYKKYGGPVVGG
jgi:hypothetical protein